VVEWWSGGEVEWWSNGVMEYWSVGGLECWSNGVLEGWSVGVLGLLEYWSTSRMASRYRSMRLKECRIGFQPVV
jgi:hypothetical protein